MPGSFLDRASRRVAGLAPAGLVQLAIRVREVVAPRPWPWDEAAVRLHQLEKRGRGPLPYPPYVYGLITAARTARAIGADAFTALEFGVAGGNGLRALEDYAELIRRWYGIHVAVVGLDSGAGLLPPTDPRDCGHALHAGAFAMNQQALTPKLRTAELILGDVTETSAPDSPHRLRRPTAPRIRLPRPRRLHRHPRCPRGDDRARPGPCPPRVPMYFDDLTGYPYTTETGERAAITAFNTKNDTRRIGQIENLEKTLGGSSRIAPWPRHMFILHTFDHSLYNAPEQMADLPDLSLKDCEPRVSGFLRAER